MEDTGDDGPSHETSPLTHAGSILGTPAYMAPEQARGADEIDARVDVYGVGALLYRMRTGIPPHPVGDPGATLQRVLRDEPRRPSDLDPEMPAKVEALIQRAMARSCELRYPTVDALADAIEALRSPSRPRAPTLADAVVVEGSPGRPTALLVGLGLGLAAAWATAVVVRLQLSPDLSTAELRLVRGLAAIAGVAVALPLFGRIKRTWPSGPAIAVLRRALSLALGAGLATFGGLELRRVGGLALGGELFDPSTAARAVAGVALAGIVFFALRPRAT
jgi:hypothetical protein